MVEQTTDPNFIATLGINWKLFLAQLVNFGVVLFVLWRWVFRPVAGALERRRQKIEGSVKKAEEIEQRMLALAETETVKLKEARLEAQQIVKTASESAAVARAETAAQARLEAEKLVREARQAIAAEKDQAMREVREEIAELTVMVAEKILRAKLDEKKDRELISDILSQMK